MKKTNILNFLYEKLLSHETKERSEHVILVIAIFSFIIHLLLIYAVDMKLIPMPTDSGLLTNPIAAIYTPFSFILIYEVYLLIYYLSKSITIYISKQYEIITLIIIRRSFKDLSALKLSSNWFEIKADLQFTYDILASLLLFYLIYLFYAQSKKMYKEQGENNVLASNVTRFVTFKKTVAVCLVPVLLVLATYSFVNWALTIFRAPTAEVITFKNINNVFFDEFFTILIIVDVILLLLSFFRTDEFHKVIRNSGFIISTILIRLSFSVEGLVSTLMIVFAVIFGLLILTIHNQYERNPMPNTR
jgi:hypothetical protein